MTPKCLRRFMMRWPGTHSVLRLKRALCLHCDMKRIVFDRINSYSSLQVLSHRTLLPSDVAHGNTS